MSMDKSILQPSVTLTHNEAEEYRAYKRQKKVTEINLAMRRSESVLRENDSDARLKEQAKRLRQAAVRMTPCDLLAKGEGWRKSGVKLDCLIGGNGETFARAKAYEAKLARKSGATEITLTLTPSLLACGRYQELKRELKRVRKAAKRLVLKARVERSYPASTLSRLAKLCSDTGMQYLSLPYFDGCERLQTELTRGCLLEVSGVETLSLFQRMTGAGVGRILTTHAWDIYTEWMQETERPPVAPAKAPPAPTLPPVRPVLPLPRTPESETNYRCRLEGSELKFL